MEIVAAIGMMAPVDLIALAAIVVIGLPHGALDGAIAIHLGFAKRLVSFLSFLFFYIAISALVVGAWLLVPTFCLFVFLIISMLHFGTGDARHGTGWLRSAEIVAHGGLVIAGISQMHQPEVDVIFRYLTGQDTTLLWQGIDILTVIVGAALIVCLAQALWYRQWRSTAVELGALAILFAMAPPLVGFAVYFCCVHSARHITGILSSLRRDMSRFALFNQATAFTLASWVAGGLAIWWFADVGDPQPVVLRVVFIGLAALTVPHMILVDGFFRRSTRSLKRQFISR